jgi:hypothetical protein
VAVEFVVEVEVDTFKYAPPSPNEMMGSSIANDGAPRMELVIFPAVATKLALVTMKEDDFPATVAEGSIPEEGGGAVLRGNASGVKGRGIPPRERFPSEPLLSRCCWYKRYSLADVEAEANAAGGGSAATGGTSA